MKKSAKIGMRVFVVIAVIVIFGYFVFGSPTVAINNQRLSRSFKAIEGDMISFNEVVPFDWDIVYTFDPYESKDQIEKTIGFQSIDVKENNISEGMVHLLFVKDKKVVASVLGYGENLGYSLDFSSNIKFEENAMFQVMNSNGIVTLTHAE